MAKKIKVTQAMIREIFDYWNECQITVHSVLSVSRVNEIRKRLEDGYTVDDLKYWILACATAWKGEDYWYSHKWLDVEDFMKRGYKQFLKEKEPYTRFKKSSSPSGEGEFGTPLPDSLSPSPALQAKKQRFLQWQQATPEERKELAKQYGKASEEN